MKLIYVPRLIGSQKKDTDRIPKIDKMTQRGSLVRINQMTIDELFQLHVTLGLSQYRGNLQALEKIIRAGEMPDVDDPMVRAYLEKLRKFLSKQGVQENNEFLLRFALTAPGAFRGIHPPISVLSPERGGFSQPRLQEAAGQVGRFREALALGYEFFPDLSSDTEVALEELARRARPSAISDEEWAGEHMALSLSETGELIQRAFRCLDATAKNVREVGMSVLQTLADCRRDGLGAATRWLAEGRIYYPGSLYRGAPNDVASGLAHDIGASEGLELNHLLVALAWTRGEIAHDAFLQWKTLSPDWTSELHVPVEDYLQEAGWALDAEGARRDLVSLSCHLILKKPASSEAVLVIPCRVPADRKCPACGGILSWLFDFSALPSKFFSGDRQKVPRKVLCCLNCACFSPIFSKYSSDGAAEWHSGTRSTEFEPSGTWPSCQCQLNPAAFPPFAAADPFHLDDASTLGGIPMWLQDSEYPRCPDCAQPMQFLAQFYNLAMPKPEEGIFYGFFCGSCQVAAVTYQQT